MARAQAPSIGCSSETFPVISLTNTMPVSGVRTTPVKKAAMPTSAKDAVGVVEAGKRPVAPRAEQKAEFRAEHQQRREQPARRRGGVGNRPEAEPDDEQDRNQRQTRAARQDLGRQRIAAADHPRPGEGERADPHADQSSARLDRQGKLSTAAMAPISVRL